MKMIQVQSWFPNQFPWLLPQSWLIPFGTTPNGPPSEVQLELYQVQDIFKASHSYTLIKEIQFLEQLDHLGKFIEFYNAL